jgi:hypothetical protein
MSTYQITIRPDLETEEYNVLLQGPGLESGGLRYVFANTYRATAFAEAVNFAYRQGLRDGKQANFTDLTDSTDDRLLVVTGTTPDNMTVRREHWWARLLRRLR